MWKEGSLAMVAMAVHGWLRLQLRASLKSW